MSSKKWYSYFVVQTPGDGAAEGTAAPERVADIAAAAGKATFEATDATPTDMADIYASAHITVVWRSLAISINRSRAAANAADPDRAA